LIGKSGFLHVYPVAGEGVVYGVDRVAGPVTP
jgi:hypothetical protein